MTDDTKDTLKFSFKDLKKDYKGVGGFFLSLLGCLICFTATYISFYVFNDYKFFKIVGVVGILFSIVVFLYFIKPIFSRIIIPFLILLIQIIILFGVFIENFLKYIHKELTKG